MSEQERTPARARGAAAQLARLSDEFFEVVHTIDPLSVPLGVLDQVVTRWIDEAR